MMPPGTVPPAPNPTPDPSPNPAGDDPVAPRAPDALFPCVLDWPKALVEPVAFPPVVPVVPRETTRPPGVAALAPPPGTPALACTDAPDSSWKSPPVIGSLYFLRR